MADNKRHILQIGRKVYAVNLQWKYVQNGSNVAAVAREDASRSGNDFFAVHTSPDGSLEYALGSKVRGHLPGIESLASTLVTGRPGSWNAIFRLPSGEFYVVSSRNGAIEPQSDQIFPSLTAAHDAISDIDPTRINQLYTDPSIQIAGASPWALEDAIKAGKHNAKLVDVNIGQMYRRFATIAALIAIIGGLGYYVYSIFWLDQPSPIVQASQHIPSPPWVNKQIAGEELSDCLNVIERLPQGAPGWKRASVACVGGSATAAYTREKALDHGGSPISWFYTAVTNQGWPRQGISEDATKGIMTYTLPLPRPRTYWTSATKVQPVDQSTAQLIKGLDRLYTPATATKPAGKYYGISKVTFDVTDLPRQYIPLLNSIPGATLESLKIVDTKKTVTVAIGEALPAKGNTHFEIDPAAAIRAEIETEFANFYAQHEKPGDF